VDLARVVTRQQVARAVREVHMRVLSRSDRTTQEHLRGVLAEVGFWSSAGQVRAVCTEVVALAELVRSRVRPPSDEVPVGHPCPWCARRMVWVWDHVEADRVQRPALLLHTQHQTVRCAACRSTWPARFAGRLIDQVRDEAPGDQRAVQALHQRVAAWARHEAVLAYYQRLAEWCASYARTRRVLGYYLTTGGGHSDTPTDRPDA
jgi:hypothetical protein